MNLPDSLQPVHHRLHPRLIGTPEHVAGPLDLALDTGGIAGAPGGGRTRRPGLADRAQVVFTEDVQHGYGDMRQVIERGAVAGALGAGQADGDGTPG